MEHICTICTDQTKRYHRTDESWERHEQSGEHQYHKQIADLTDWFKSELKYHPPFEITEAQYSDGIDSLPEGIRELCGGTFVKWELEKNYQLSYNQMNKAFFQAVRALGILTVKRG